MVADTDTSLLDCDETTAASYVYDDAGNRVAETVATGGTSVTSFYLTDQANPTGYAQPVEVWTSTDGSRADAGLHETYLLGDRVLGQVDASVAASVAASYLLTDGHGSTRQLTDASGLITHAFTYDAFGTALNFNASAAPTVFLFGGDSVYDPASGLYMHGNGVRDRLGFEFIQRDSAKGKNGDPLSLHKYLYAEANPISGIDPSGHDLADDAFNLAADIAQEASGILNFLINPTALGGSSIPTFQQGGPDITVQLAAIAHFILNYNLPHRTLPSTGIFYVTWDIEPLPKWGNPGNPAAPGMVTVGGSTFSTATVAGHVYRPEDVNYFLWGLWNAANGVGLDVALAKVRGYRMLGHLDTGGGRLDWTSAGYYDNFSLATPSAVMGAVAGSPYKENSEGSGVLNPETSAKDSRPERHSV